MTVYRFSRTRSLAKKTQRVKRSRSGFVHVYRDHLVANDDSLIHINFTFSSNPPIKVKAVYIFKDDFPLPFNSFYDSSFRNYIYDDFTLVPRKITKRKNINGFHVIDFYVSILIISTASMRPFIITALRDGEL